jgi:hypothetical protein
MVQFNLGGGNTTHTKQYMCRMMIMLCQWGFNEQVEKLVRLFLCTSENVQENSRPGYILYPVSK